jgi:hypothetical protein
VKSTLRDLTDWPLQWFPEIQLGVLLSLAVSLAFPPFAIDSSPGQTAFLGWHSLFTQDAGYVSLSRLGLFWLLVVVVAACAQLSAQRCAGDLQPNRLGAFATPVGSSLLSGNAILAVLLALPTWFFLCGLALGRSRILGLEDQLAYLGCVAFQLIVVSRLLIWISRERTNLMLGYLILALASLAWDLRTSPTPEARVAGLVPLYLMLGYLLYRFDLRFANATPPAPVVPHPPADQSVAPIQAAALSPKQASAPAPETDAPSEPEAKTEIPPDAPVLESEVQQRPKSAEDPYQRYRPKPPAEGSDQD